MKKFQYSGIVLLFVILVSCQGNKEHSHSRTQTAQLIHSVNKFNDSVFFSHSQCLAVHHDLIFMSDYKNNRVIAFSENLELINMFGESGSGPGEMLFTDKLFVTDSSILVEENLRISEFGIDGEYYQTIKPPEKLGSGDLFVRFSADKNHIIASGINNKIVVFDKNSHVINEFGSDFNTEYIPEKFWPRVRSHLFITENENIISASSNDPVIELYNLQNELLNRCVYDTLSFLDDKWNSLHEFYTKNNNNMRQLVADAFYAEKDEKLYLLLIDTILVFKLEKDQIKFSKQIVFDQDKDSDYFMSLAVKDGILFLFNHVRGTIEKYKIN